MMQFSKKRHARRAICQHNVHRIKRIGEAMPAPLNIILIDDHPLLRMGVAGYIEQEQDLRLTAQLANAAELRAWIEAVYRADAALLDRSLPDADGLDLVSDLRDLCI